eukprot:TRINITY_DN6720_c0_g2_i1.p1 TRINITY_DN6720_c0_g2~~TRINITY_DN6720_c0_g2_i1.p1  ORF type:complete len:374 (-),score=118.26 TRINITY_DN6720_c0_g2_i1:162-1262(-)
MLQFIRAKPFALNPFPTIKPSQLSKKKYSTQQTRVLVSNSNDSLFNLATEEWIFHHLDVSKQTLFLWRNNPVVVIGKHQNPWKECHLEKMKKNEVVLARRYTGGGAVYQDLGNTCFTFLSHKDQFDKDRNSRIILDALKTFGVEGEASGRNDLTVNGKKISGSAYKHVSDRKLHHGTLLIDVNLDSLQEYLNVNKEKLKSKGVDSVRARVSNLHDLNPKITHNSLSDALIKQFQKHYGSDCPIEYLDTELLRGEPLLNKTFETLNDWDWRYGTTPHFEHNVEKRFDWGLFDIYFTSKGGRISEAKVFSDCLIPSLVDELQKNLLGVTYDSEGIQLAIGKTKQSLLPSNPECENYLNQLEKWLVEVI